MFVFWEEEIHEASEIQIVLCIDAVPMAEALLFREAGSGLYITLDLHSTLNLSERWLHWPVASS